MSAKDGAADIIADLLTTHSYADLHQILAVWPDR